MSNIKKNESYRKSETISIKCTKEEKQKIEKAANHNGKTVSNYALDCSLAGKESGKSRRRRRATALVEQQENLNALYKEALASGTASELNSKIQTVLIGGMSLWEF